MRLPRHSRGRALLAFRILALGSVLALVVSPAQKKQKDEKEEEVRTQTLELPRELPPAVSGETRRLTFHVTPLSAKGLLSQQVRDALRALTRQTGGPVLRIRAFVAGSGDARRVRDLVSEIFTGRRQPLPVLSLVHTGGLPMEGAQVVLEAIAVARKEVNPHGLAFIAPAVATSDNPLDPVAPLTAKSIESLNRSLAAVGLEKQDVVRVSCFLSSLENWIETRKLVQAEYPAAAANYVQTQRAPSRAMAACEAVARLRSAPGQPLRLTAAASAEGLPGESQVALVGARQVVLTGTQASFGYQESDSRLAFERIRKVIEAAGTSTRQVAWINYYPLSGGIANQVRKIHTELFDSAHSPAVSLIIFEALPSMDAGFAADVIAVKD